MLQQTQAERVVERYRKFLTAFPTIAALAAAPLGAVLREWQGLGYNRRAKMLHTCARRIMEDHGGKFPKDHATLVALPGIGDYTAAAVLAFAYNIPIPLIETNVRSVYIHHFFNDATDVRDAEILMVVDHTLDRTNPRIWYWALMDYGAHIKRTYGNPNSRSKHYTRQSAFQGSNRQIRGAILQLLTERTFTRHAIHAALAFDISRVDAQLERLLEEGMIEKNARSYRLPV
jgi:A/G-specific adenine glycosylase